MNNFDPLLLVVILSDKALVWLDLGYPMHLMERILDIKLDAWYFQIHKSSLNQHGIGGFKMWFEKLERLEKLFKGRRKLSLGWKKDRAAVLELIWILARN